MPATRSLPVECAKRSQCYRHSPDTRKEWTSSICHKSGPSRQQSHSSGAWVGGSQKVVKGSFASCSPGNKLHFLHTSGHSHSHHFWDSVMASGSQICKLSGELCLPSTSDLASSDTSVLSGLNDASAELPAMASGWAALRNPGTTDKASCHWPLSWRQSRSPAVDQSPGCAWSSCVLSSRSNSGGGVVERGA